MSGGVDSSVAAALLQQQGYQVIGLMLNLWSEPGQCEANRCCSPDAMAQARRVAAILGIPFYAIDAKQVFFDTVVTSFLKGYTQGLTPNPCLVCNRQIRWGFLLKHALNLGADYLATGHYARIQRDSSHLLQLYQSTDLEKDQSYVLHTLNQEQLEHTLFPIGNLTKPQVRQIARDIALPVAERPDSQDLCFLGDGNYRSFLQRHAPQSLLPGPILLDDEQIGQHRGLPFYTIGQRKGLGLSSPVSLYVLEKDLSHNALRVGRQASLSRQELIAGPVNWISGQAPAGNFRTQVKIRYKATPAWGQATLLDEQKIHVQFDHPLRDITPGQAAVFYDGPICLGGGEIQL